jgi:selenocysteine lyase/cysteine desulfurase
MAGSGWSRREFSRLLAFGGSAALLPAPGAAARPFVPQGTGEAFWEGVRDQFLMPRPLAMFNAANLCPASRRVVDALERASREIDRDPSPANRVQLGVGREAARGQVAAFLNVAPETIVLTRNTSESNNLVSSGLDFGSGDDVLVFEANHPSNRAAWTQKAERRGFAVRALEYPSPHPGAEFFVDLVSRSITPRTRLLAFSHVTADVGDLLPAAALCRLARERGVMTLVDGAQSFGVLDIDLAAMQPDFYTGSAHKWPCGARENGVLYVNPAVESRLAPSVVSLYGGAVGVSRRIEANGQRDEAAMIAFGEAVTFQMEVGKARIEARARALASALVEGFRRIDGVTLQTSADAAHRAAIVTIQPGASDARRMGAALYEDDRIICAARGNTLRFSPHFYNTLDDVTRAVTAVERRMRG